MTRPPASTAVSPLLSSMSHVFQERSRTAWSFWGGSTTGLAGAVSRWGSFPGPVLLPWRRNKSKIVVGSPSGSIGDAGVLKVRLDVFWQLSHAPQELPHLPLQLLPRGGRAV